ncbi:uncharacterized protein LOC143911330 isoform X1 [Arctopsyche grandis]|uniref:uncharacterized protein LOC143911330 isoform X1 n=2 Tax=Arctopsyche grandis TaxID=121162 RepID=UPI00406DA2B0
MAAEKDITVTDVSDRSCSAAAMSTSRSDCELPSKMASLDLWDSTKAEVNPSAVNEEETSDKNSSENSTRRTLRKRPSPNKNSTVTNRRVIMKPKKIQQNPVTEEDLKKLYSNTKVKTVSQKLETIFEEPKAVNNTLLFIGGTKIKRSLKFQDSNIHTKEKIKKRRSKIKRLLGNKNFANRKKISMQAFLKTLQNLEADDAIDECKND